MPTSKRAGITRAPAALPSSGRREARSSGSRREDGRPGPHREEHPNPRAQSGAEGSGPREDREPRPLGRSTYLESVGQRKGLESAKRRSNRRPAGFAVVLTAYGLRPPGGRGLKTSVRYSPARVPRESPGWGGRGLRGALSPECRPSGSSLSPDPRGRQPGLGT